MRQVLTQSDDFVHERKRRLDILMSAGVLVFFCFEKRKDPVDIRSEEFAGRWRKEVLAVHESSLEDR
jgi:hypothetical protein